jgi:hypothetical protein
MFARSIVATFLVTGQDAAGPPKGSGAKGAARFEVWIADQSDTRTGFGGQLRSAATGAAGSRSPGTCSSTPAEAQ